MSTEELQVIDVLQDIRIFLQEMRLQGAILVDLAALLIKEQLGEEIFINSLSGRYLAAETEAMQKRQEEQISKQVTVYNITNAINATEVDDKVYNELHEASRRQQVRAESRL